MAVNRMQQFEIGSACQQVAKTAINDYPLTTILTCFGIGLGIGVGVACLLSGSEESSAPSMVQKMMNSAARMLPDAVARHLPT